MDPVYTALGLMPLDDLAPTFPSKNVAAKRVGLLRQVAFEAVKATLVNGFIFINLDSYQQEFKAGFQKVGPDPKFPFGGDTKVWFTPTPGALAGLSSWKSEIIATASEQLPKAILPPRSDLSPLAQEVLLRGSDRILFSKYLYCNRFFLSNQWAITDFLKDGVA